MEFQVEIVICFKQGWLNGVCTIGIFILDGNAKKQI